MTPQQTALLIILGTTIIMFLWGKWRYDLVAMGALLATVVTGLVPANEAFSGFGHPAVITVACVLILSQGLQVSGAVDMLVQRVVPQTKSISITVAVLTFLAASLSAFMNNVGALALLMPMAIQTAHRQGLPPGRLLMPLAFGSILGGMTTLIGTPPNLIVASFSAAHGVENFAMFDFTPVGAAVAFSGLFFVALIGWRLVPMRERAGIEGFETSAYLTEARIPEKTKAADMTLRQIEEALDEADAQVIGLIRDEVRITAPSPGRKVRAGDILVIEAEPTSLAAALSSLGLKLEEDVREEEKEEEQPEEDKKDAKKNKKSKKETAPKMSSQSDDIVLMEMAILPHSMLAGRSASGISLRTRFGINLLAVSREGLRSMGRLRTMALREGDVLLMQGSPDTLSEFAYQYNCVPLATRSLRLPDKKQAFLAMGIMFMAVSSAAFGVVPASIAFAAGVLLSMGFKITPLSKVYDLIDWPVIVLLAALIPVAGAMASTGAADVIARFLLDELAQGHAVFALAVILVLTMTLSDFMNNAATAAVMCPVAIGTAAQLGASPSPFLMAVAIGASCAFLTPIGHQNNTLILGPGGFHFGDYWKLGLPLEIIVVAVSIPMLLLIWPL